MIRPSVHRPLQTVTATIMPTVRPPEPFGNRPATMTTTIRGACGIDRAITLRFSHRDSKTIRQPSSASCVTTIGKAMPGAYGMVGLTTVQRPSPKLCRPRWRTVPRSSRDDAGRLKPTVTPTVIQTVRAPAAGEPFENHRQRREVYGDRMATISETVGAAPTTPAMEPHGR
jgi:hypothetical protein